MSDQQRQSWVNAWQRAVSERLIPYRLDATSWLVKSYMVTATGPAWHALSCDCAAGQRGIPCKHGAVVAKARSLAQIPGQAPVLGTMVGRA